MDEENKVVQPEVEQEAQPETIVEDEDLTALQEKLNKEVEARRQLTARAQKAEADKKALESKLKEAHQNASKGSLDVGDYIDISASLDGLDQNEKEYLAQQHKYTGTPLKEIRNDKNFLLWQRAYRQDVEKERTLSPSNKQTETERPRTLTEKLAGASMEEKEKLLRDAGLYKDVRPRADRQNIGRI